NCWLALFEREESLTVPELTHRTVATNRLRLLYLAAGITRHGGQSEIHFGAQYQERNRFDQLMVRWRAIERSLPGFAPVIHTPLRAWKSMHGAMARRQTGPKGEISKTKLLAQSPDADGGCAVATKRSGQAALAVHNLGSIFHRGKAVREAAGGDCVTGGTKRSGQATLAVHNLDGIQSPQSSTSKV
ncbi:MAG: hypothetical protein K7J46_15465, partial [Bryobacter sp.]|nr:hypothetical protein [Bryobacter sp. CoA8 C33]